MKVKKSAENKVFLAYIKYLGDNKTKAATLTQQRSTLKEDSEEYKKMTDEIQAISSEVLAYQKQLIADNSDKLVSKIVNMSLEVVVPDAPKDEAGNIIDSNFRFKYYRDHFFDNVDLKDDRLVNTPIFHNKIDTYFSKRMMIQHWDTVIAHAYEFIDQLNPKI